MNRVKDYRLLLGISQLDLAKAIGVSRQTVNMIENNKNILRLVVRKSPTGESTHYFFFMI
ncbi:helix-turn-helix transcriptional regulator, partial [Streptococcus suis]